MVFPTLFTKLIYKIIAAIPIMMNINAAISESSSVDLSDLKPPDASFIIESMALLTPAVVVVIFKSWYHLVLDDTFCQCVWYILFESISDADENLAFSFILWFY